MTPGSRLGAYEILEPIGAGGMGQVYRARHVKLGRDVAIKVLRPELASDPERLRRFEQEARSASALNHPNIIHIYDIGEHEGTPFIAMEFVEGRTLRDVLSGGALSAPKLLELATQIAEGLLKAHSAGIIHRDLKPDNLLVSRDGYVKILDFGLAKLLPEPSGLDSEMATREKIETREGVVVGTVQYMSPEQARGHPVDFRSDQFSFGSILYEMATGKLAFPRDSWAQTMAAIIEDEPAPISKIHPEVPAELVAIVERCLQKVPVQRYDSTAELARALRSFPAIREPRPSRRTLLWSGVGVLAAFLALVLGANLDRWRESMAPGGTPSTIQSIAVLPLQNLSGDPEQEYLADGMTEALITDLAKIGALKVISRTSAMRYKGSDKPLSQIAQELDVDAVLEGSSLRSGDRVRITAQLIDVEEDQALWAESYERAFGDLLVLQSEVARAVAREIEVTVTPEESKLLASSRPVNAEAHEAYLKGRFHAQKLTPADLEAALSYFELALEEDPEYAPAHVGVAYVWGGRSQMGYVAPDEAGPRAKAALLRALELDDSLAAAHHMLAAAQTWGEWDWTSAERSFRRAIELNPNDADVRRSYSHYLAIMGRLDDAMAQIERALELDPFNAMSRAFHGVILVFARRYDDAIEEFRNALRTVPNLPVARMQLATAFHLQGRVEEALEAEKEFRAAIGDREAVEALTRGYAEGGYRGAMRHLAENAEERSMRTRTNAVRVARLYLRAGENERALESLERAFEHRDPGLPYAAGAPIYDSLRDRPRFRELLRRMHLPS